MQLKDILLKKYHNKIIRIFDSDGFSYDISNITIQNGKIIIDIKDEILHQSTPLGTTSEFNNVEDLALNKEWRERNA